MEVWFLFIIFLNFGLFSFSSASRSFASLNIDEESANRLFYFSKANNASSIFSVRSFGAIGDGVQDDTAAFQKCFDVATPLSGTVYIPTGIYKITSSVTIKAQVPYQIRGDGYSSVVAWNFDGHLFNFASVQNEITISDIKILSTSSKSRLNAAFMFSGGLTRSLITHILVTSEGSSEFYPSSGIRTLQIMDSCSITNSQFWFLKGTGIEIARGSEVRIIGGRIIGDSRTDSNIGIHVSGNNGGVHIISTDVISHNIGILLDDTYGAGSNREIFINQATMDSNDRGLYVNDSSYVSIAGIWAASSNSEQVYVAPNLPNPILVIVGGTIFNGGVLGGDCRYQCNGITVNSGRFSITGTEIRNNKGIGVYVPSQNVQNYVISGCVVFQNGRGFNLLGNDYIIANNVCSQNNSPNNFGGGSTKIVMNNVDC